MTSSKRLMRGVALVSCLAASCATAPPGPGQATLGVMPRTQPPAETLKLDSSQVPPMYSEMLAIDLQHVVQVATDKNVDILKARQQVEASRGQLESAAASIFPVIAPSVVLDHLQGVNRSDTGQLVGVNFTTLQPAVLVQFILNPGHVFYDVIASKRRLLATEQQERHIVMETIRSSAVQYYDLILAQSRILAAREAVAAAEELLRLTRLRLQAGTGLPADDLRAQANLAGRQQDLAIALNVFYQSSITLASTLYLEPTVTLVPKPDPMAPVRLVREDLGIVDLLAIATQRRPDLQGIKYAAAAATAATKSTLWGGVSPQLQAGYQFGRLSSETPGQTFPLQEQQHGNASVGWLLSPTVFGQVKTAKATEQDAALEVERRFEQVRAQVVRSAQDSATNAKLIPIAKQQEAAAEEALRLAQRNLGAGTALTVDVLQAEDALNEAQLRYADAATAYNKSQVNLLAALGLIDSVSLSPGASPDAPAPALQLQSIADIPLGGHPTRFDYASLDAGRHLLFIAHLGDSEVIVFDTEARRVVKRIANVSHVHGVLAIPELGRVYASATGTNEVVAIDDKTLQIIARMPGGTYPDGLAYSPETRKVYVSDEHGGTDTVLDVVTNKRVATVPIGGVIGNTQYDDSSHHMFISAQSDNQLVEVDPQTDMIVRRVLVPGAQENHGLLIDSASHRAFVACQGNDQLIVIDLRTGAAIAQFPVAKDPDVLAFDASRQTLYVAGESGQVSEFKVSDGKISKTGESLLARNAHVVAIHPMTHEIYFPIMDVDGKPVLRIMRGGG